MIDSPDDLDRDMKRVNLVENTKGIVRHMPLTVKVKSNVPVWNQRKEAAELVVAHFGDRLPDRSLLCFFDDDDWPSLKSRQGSANRGGFLPLGGTTRDTCRDVPDYLIECLFDGDQRLFDHLIYLNGPTCRCMIGLTMTFAHELQHFIQHVTKLKLWAESRLIRKLPKPVIDALDLKWGDVPHEHEARLVAKRTAEDLFGTEKMGQYIEAKINQPVEENDRADWKFIRRLVTSTPYDLASETRLLFSRLTGYRQELDQTLEVCRCEDPAYYADIHVDALLRGDV